MLRVGAKGGRVSHTVSGNRAEISDSSNYILGEYSNKDAALLHHLKERIMH